jgi:drug/metabolite transporter (DMT)-like permease
MNSLAHMALFTFMVFVCAYTQIFLKKNANKNYVGIRVYLNKTVILSNVIFLLATLVSVFTLKYIQLSVGALLNSLTYVFIPVLSAVFLKEKIGKRTVLGIVMIMAGMTVYTIWGIEINVV